MNPINCGWKKYFLCVLPGLATTCGPTLAATTLANLNYSPDTTIAVTPATILIDDMVATDDAGTITLIDLGVLPANVAVDGFHRRADDGALLFSLDTTAVLGGIVARPGDVVRYATGIYSLEFDASAAGLSANVDVEAVSMRGTRSILAFDTAVVLGGTVFQDEDLAAYDGTTFTMLFDGSAAGVAPGLALDAAEVLANGQLLLSFDGSGQLGTNIVFADEDVLEYAPAGGLWELVFDGSVAAPVWVAADLEAVAATAGGGLIFSDQFEN